MIYFLGDDAFAVVQIPTEHGFFEVFSLLDWGVVTGNFGFEATVLKCQPGGGDSGGRHNGKWIFFAEVEMFLAIDKAFLGLLMNSA